MMRDINKAVKHNNHKELRLTVSTIYEQGCSSLTRNTVPFLSSYKYKKSLNDLLSFQALVWTGPEISPAPYPGHVQLCFEFNTKGRQESNISCLTSVKQTPCSPPVSVKFSVSKLHQFCDKVHGGVEQPVKKDEPY